MNTASSKRKEFIVSLSLVLIFLIIICASILIKNKGTNGPNEPNGPTDDPELGWQGEIYGSESMTDIPEVVFAKDYETKYSSDYSLKIENTDYAYAYLSKTMIVEKGATYKMSAMVKYQGYDPKPLYGPDGNTGADLYAIAQYNYTNTYSGSEWKKIEYTFMPKLEMFGDAETMEITLYLSNGNSEVNCRGTAWFSDIQIEKAELANRWNILFLNFTSIDVTVDYNGNPNYRHTNYVKNIELLEESVAAQKEVPALLEELSGGLMTVNTYDIVVIDDPITRMTGFRGLEPIDIEEVLDRYLAQDEYHQIVVIYPADGPAFGHNYEATGTGAYVSYKGHNIGFAQVNIIGFSGNRMLYVHEILHGVEGRAGASIKSHTASLHDPGVYGYAPENSEYAVGQNEYDWYQGFLRNTLPDGRGMPPEVYMVPTGVYQVISDDMTRTP